MKKIKSLVAFLIFYVGTVSVGLAADCEDFGGTYLVCTLEEEQEIFQAARNACDGDLPSSGLYIIYPDSCPREAN